MVNLVAAAGGGAAGVYAANIEALKAMGPIVYVEPQQFLAILEKVEKPLVVHSSRALWTNHKYLTSYKGLVFFTKSKDALLIPASVEVAAARKISVPQM